MKNAGIIGMNETLAELDRIRSEFPRKVALPAIKRSMSPFIKAAIAANADIPGAAKTIAAKSVKGVKSEVAVSTGAWGSKKSPKHKSQNNKNKKPMKVFYLIYWKNYGTLSNRNTLHRFVFNRKSRSAKWKGGVSPSGSLEKAWETTKNAVIANFPVEAKKALDKFLAKGGKL